ncbi:MAG TPA: cell filamentation protein Fic, partial [Acidobacteriota bacterium]
GLVFPVSSVMLDRIEAYRLTLQSHSGPLMNYIDWRPLPNGNVEVMNETADLYRYADYTDEAEFLYSCVERTVETDLPREIEYIKSHDEAMKSIMDAVEMPNRLAQDLIMHIRQNGGKLSKKRRVGEFEKLTEHEVDTIEKIVADAYERFNSTYEASA